MHHINFEFSYTVEIAVHFFFFLNFNIGIILITYILYICTVSSIIRIHYSFDEFFHLRRKSHIFDTF